MMRAFGTAVTIRLWIVVLVLMETVGARPNHLVGKYPLHRRHGAQIPSSGRTTAVDDAVDELVAVLKRTERRRDDEARLWRRLGKLLLDAGEYAEAPILFRRGAGRCPDDEGLNHHSRVYDAFHGEADGSTDDGGGGGGIGMPAPLQPSGRDEDVFLALDVPRDAIPNAIARMAELSSGNDSPPPSSPLTNLVYASKEPILSKEACRYVVDRAKKAAEEKGWTTDRHVQAPTCDVPAFELGAAAVGWLRHAVVGVLFPLLAAAFPPEIGIDPGLLRVQDMFVVRYDGGGGGGDGRPGFEHLKPHEDESIISLTIALNDMSDYGGGGLFIASTGDLLNGDAGTVLSFAGQIVHGGYPVTRGTRWILTGFLYINKNCSGEENGYILEEIENRVQQN